MLDPPILTRRSQIAGITTLYSLCFVNRVFLREARPWLYRRISIALPASFESLVGTIGVLSPEATIADRIASTSALRSSSHEAHLEASSLPDQVNDFGRLHLEDLDSPSPPSSREQSLDRGRGQAAHQLSPPSGATARDRGRSPGASNFFMRISAEEALSRRFTQQFARPWREDNPGLLTESITFERFRSHGLRRTGREGSQQRFVTPERVLQILRGTRQDGDLHSEQQSTDAFGRRSSSRSGLKAVGFTEYVDSAITFDVLQEVFLRGGHEIGDLVSGSAVALQTTPVEAVDFCGCVSRTYIEALNAFITAHSLSGHGSHAQAVAFPHLRRLGLYNVLVASSSLTAFVSAFPSLTHLDLGNTRATPALLTNLGASTTLCLQSISLSRCQMLDSASIHAFLTRSSPNVLADLTELNLYFDPTSSSPLNREHLVDVVTTSRVFSSGRLRFLDLSTAPLDDAVLALVPHQPSLVDLGMSHCPNITWRGLQTFLRTSAPEVQILSVRGSCRQSLIPAVPGRVARRNDHLLNSVMGVHQCLIPTVQRATSRLRVIEVEEKA